VGRGGAIVGAGKVGSDNQITAGFTVAGTPVNLALSVHPSDVTVAPGAAVAFAIVVENHGDAVAANVSIAASLPSSITLVSLLSSTAACDAAAARCTVASLGAGESAIVNAIVNAHATGSVDVVAGGKAASLHVIVVDHPRRRAAGR